MTVTTRNQMTHTQLSYFVRQVLKTQKMLDEGMDFQEIDEVFTTELDTKVNSEELWNDPRTQKLLEVMAL